MSYRVSDLIAGYGVQADVHGFLGVIEQVQELGQRCGFMCKSALVPAFASLPRDY